MSTKVRIIQTETVNAIAVLRPYTQVFLIHCCIGKNLLNLFCENFSIKGFSKNDGDILRVTLRAKIFVLSCS